MKARPLLRIRYGHRNLDMLTPSLPLSRSLDFPVCLAASQRLGSGSKMNHSKTANLPEPDVITAEIVEDLEAGLQQFAQSRKI